MKAWTVGLLLLVPVAGLGPSGPHEAQAPDEKPILVAHAGSLPVVMRAATAPVVLDYPRRRVPAPVTITPPVVVRSIVHPPVAQSNRIWTQSEIVCAAATDAARLPAEIRQYVRYLDMGNLPPGERQDAIRILTGHVHHLSREPDIVPLTVVPGTDYSLARLNIIDYGWDAKTWDALADSDPYYHVTLETKVEDVVTVWPGGVWPDDGQFYAAGSFKYHAPKKSKQRAIAPWVVEGADGQAAVSSLVTLLGTPAPMTRGDWWFNRTAIQADRSPTGYYDFLRVKNEADFRKLVGFDPKLAEPFGKEIREAVSDSGVTLQPRAIWRDNAQGGGYWRSIDFKQAVDTKNPLRVLGKDIEKNADATEQFGFLPNGFWATGLFNGKGERQDFAPPEIASDHMSKSNDRRVHINLCVRCHYKGGLQDVDGWAKNLFQAPLQLQGPDYRVIQKLRRQYLRDMTQFISRDRELNAVSVREATGWATETYYFRYGEFWSAYEDAKVDAAYAARSLGTTPEKFRAAIAHQIKQLGQSDTVLSVFLLQGDRARTIPVRQWEELTPLAHAALRGVYLPP